MLSRFARLLLVLTSLAPVSLVYGVSYLPDRKWPALQWGCVAAFLVVACLSVMRGALTHGERHTVNAQRAKNVDKDVLAFLVSYALPLISPVHGESNALAFWTFLAVVAVVLYQAELVHVNPLLGMLGYRFYEIEQEGGDNALLIARSKSSRANITVVKLSTTLWLERPDAY